MKASLLSILLLLEEILYLYNLIKKANFTIKKKKMIEFLEANGADYNTLNNQGLNVLHIASQGDQPVSLVITNLSKTINEFIFLT